jgi:magnesium transporter
MADQSLEVVEVVRSRVDALEERVLNQEEQTGITELYQLRRQLTALRRVLAPEVALIGSRATPISVVANPDIQDAMLDVKYNMQSAVDDVDQYLNALPDILTTFEALKSDGLNRIVKLLTVWSIILTAVALFPTVLGISLSREPSISPYIGYVISIGTMVLVGALIWYLFKRRGWTE